MRNFPRFVMITLVLAITLFAPAKQENDNDISVSINSTASADDTYISRKGPDASATDYLIQVGSHEVSFQIESSSFFEKGYRTIYNSNNLAPRHDYTPYETTIVDDSGSFLSIEVRDFRDPMPLSAQNISLDTIDDLLQIIPHLPGLYLLGNGIIVKYTEMYG